MERNLKAELAALARHPVDHGVLTRIVRRLGEHQHDFPAAAELSLDEGLVGDRWAADLSSSERQLTLIERRIHDLVAGPEPGQLSGDNLHVELDLSLANLPPGSHLEVGEATIEVTAAPHHGCSLFERRFGKTAREWVNSPDDRPYRLRGLHARVILAGVVRTGDRIQVISRP